MTMAHDDGHHEPAVSESTELDELLFALDPDRRAAFVLTQINGLRYEEAAELLEVPIGTVRSRVARARTELVTAIHAAERDAGEPDELRRRPSG